MSPKQYAQYNQLMFAKQLLHSSTMSISDIGLASGFNSVRRFNDAFQKILKLTPSDIRKGSNKKSVGNQLTIAFRPPFDWAHLLNFYRLRAVKGVEDVGENHYQRTFTLGNTKGWFKASHTQKNTLAIEFEIDDITQLKMLVTQIRRVFDLDADIAVIETHLSQTALNRLMTTGIRIPGVWNTWEAGVRAILGQQISVKAAITQLNTFVDTLGMHEHGDLYFPTPEVVANGELSFLKMPQSRKDTVKRFAEYMVDHFEDHPSQWLAIKGIGPWTISYAKLRGLSEPNCFLATDLVVKKVIATFDDFDEKSTSPWGSYATFHCWNSQS
ncbi:DNA-3-methyladenine glycosylase 2 [Photobacterium sagamiensis]|uniref:DNA-3-methyladenine glycosylase 2 n=1 Tax=Photobacterium sagamiensis TaxID=2910241 RepID=UPI003D0C4150